MVSANDAKTACWLAAAAALSFGLLGQTTLYHNDGHRLLELLHRGELDFGRHYLSLPTMVWFDRLVGGPLGLSPQRSVTWLNALCSGAAVGLTFVAARRLGEPRRRALLAAGLFAGTFPVFFFATLVEFHGIYLAFAIASFLLAARWAAAPGFRAAVWTGAMAGLATQWHASGILLVPSWALWFWGERRDLPAVRRALQIVVAGAAYLAVFLPFQQLWQSVGWAESIRISRAPFGLAMLQHLAARLPVVFWTDWIRPFLPMSLLLFWAVLRGRQRFLALAVLTAAVAYSVLGAIVLGVSELGVYAAPLAAPLAILAVRVLPTRFAAVVIVGLLLFGTAAVLRHDSEGARYRDFVRGLAVLRADADVVVLFCEHPAGRIDERLDELAAIRVFAPDTAVFVLTELAAREPAELEPSIGPMVAAWGQLHRGRRVLLGRGSRDRLAQEYASGQLLLDALAGAYDFVPRLVDGFDGFELVPR
jgi:hypothetical protein